MQYICHKYLNAQLWTVSVSEHL